MRSKPGSMQHWQIIAAPHGKTSIASQWITTFSLELAREPIDICGTVAALAIESRPASDRLNLTLDVTIPPGPCMIEGDPQRVQQTVSNLLAQCAEVHDLRRSGAHPRRTAAPRCRDQRLRHRGRDPGGIPASRLRAVPAGGSIVHAAPRRPWASASQSRRSSPNVWAGQSKRGVKARVRLDFHRPVPARRLTASVAGSGAPEGLVGQTAKGCGGRCSLRGRPM